MNVICNILILKNKLQVIIASVNITAYQTLEIQIPLNSRNV